MSCKYLNDVRHSAPITYVPQDCFLLQFLYFAIVHHFPSQFSVVPDVTNSTSKRSPSQNVCKIAPCSFFYMREKSHATFSSLLLSCFSTLVRSPISFFSRFRDILLESSSLMSLVSLFTNQGDRCIYNVFPPLCTKSVNIIDHRFF